MATETLSNPNPTDFQPPEPPDHRCTFLAALTRDRPVGGGEPLFPRAAKKVFLKSEEYFGKPYHSKEEFSEAIFDSGLIDVGFEGGLFTWTDHRIWQRLNCVLFASEWIDVFPYNFVHHLPRSSSDHCPLLIKIRDVATSGPSSFSFQNMWTRHLDFICVVKDSWSRPTLYKVYSYAGQVLTVEEDLWRQKSQCWKVIKHDVTEAVQDFLNGTPLPISFTATTIILIPKVKNPMQWTNFRPISLCNTTNKILMKLINKRLKLILPDLVVLNQSGFVPKWLIVDNILLAQEIMHCIVANTKGWNVALKLDMAKA
ncbi:hypothetical protein Sango_2834200 [Sesamum angolense]|uniref:Reverse transcriptase domain-containing protein n=1 Tax=Sesamum angolense TaxID=2727404 RepID=A0AAE1T6I6_9LAMI|nr:hypothetical protein Sango_2834200 [Sesamum angolense]